MIGKLKFHVSLILTIVILLTVNVEGVKAFVEYEGDPGSKSSPTVVDGIILVNKKNPLPKTYAPKVTTIQGQKGTQEAVNAMNKMVKGAKDSMGYDIRVVSGYRDYSYQENLYKGYVDRDGKESADKYSARPGFSEHQTGLTFDVLSGKTTTLIEAFGDTSEGKWIAENAYKYGFIVRYPKGKESITGYQYEPWHLRYIGEEKAKDFKESGKTTLEEYLNVGVAEGSGGGSTGETGGTTGGGSSSGETSTESFRPFYHSNVGKTSAGVDGAESEVPTEVSYVASQKVKMIYKTTQIIMAVLSAFLVLYLGLQMALVVVMTTGYTNEKFRDFEKKFYGERKRDEEGKEESIYKLLIRNSIIVVVCITIVLGSFYVPLQGKVYELIESILLLIF